MVLLAGMYALCKPLYLYFIVPFCIAGDFYLNYLVCNFLEGLSI